MSRVLVVDDEAGIRGMLEVVLRRDGHEVLSASDGSEALAIIDQQSIDLLVTDLRMDGMDGLALLGALRERKSELFTIVMTAFADWDTAVQAMRMGAYNFVAKPFDNQALRTQVQRALDAREHYLAAKAEGGEHENVHLIGSSEGIQEVQQLVEQVSTTDATILVTGASGTGKELVARAVHYASLRADGPLVRINSGALAPSLLESELFGHRKGAFTGAIEDRQGLFALADGGTLFLDEVGDLAPETQVKLLRVLESGEYLPVGDSEVRSCNVRLVAATNKSLEDMVQAGSFREDLYYRLAVISIHLPALRERREDIPLLAGHLLSRHAVRLRHGVSGFTTQAMDALCSYSWPGNVRELDNRIQRGVALTSEGEIEAEALFGDLAETQSGMWSRIKAEGTDRRERRETRNETSGALERRSTPIPADERQVRDLRKHLTDGGSADLEGELHRFEKALIGAAIEACDDNMTEAAKRLGLSFRQIRYKAKQLGLR